MHRVLVPVDKNENRASKQAEYVTSLPCDPEEIEVRVIHVNEADYEGAAPLEFDDIPAAVSVVEAVEDAGFDCEQKLVAGRIARNILEESEEFDADDIVMAGRDRSGVMKVIMGSVTQDIILSTERPVTVVG